VFFFSLHGHLVQLGARWTFFLFRWDPPAYLHVFLFLPPDRLSSPPSGLFARSHRVCEEISFPFFALSLQAPLPRDLNAAGRRDVRSARRSSRTLVLTLDPSLLLTRLRVIRSGFPMANGGARSHAPETLYFPPPL